MPIDRSYSQLMAEMIAQARPRAAGGQTLPRVIEGGGGGGARSSETFAQANVNLGQAVEAFRKLMGYKPPEEKSKLLQAASQRIEATKDPTERQRLEHDPFLQIMLEELETKDKVPLSTLGWYRSGERTPLGKPVYKYAPTLAETVPPEERGRIAAYGPSAAATLAGREMELKAEKPLTEARVRRETAEAERAERLLPIELQVKQREIDKLNLEMNRLNTLMPLETRALEAEQLYKEAEARLKDMEAKYYPEKLAAERTESEVRLSLIRKQSALAEMETAKVQKELALISGDLTREERASMDKIQSDFDRFRNQWELNASKLGVSAANRQMLLQDLESIASSTIASIHARARSPEVAAKFSEPAFRYWFNQADVEMRQPVRTRGLISKKPDEEDIARRKYYIQATINLLKQSGVRSADVYDKLRQWAQSIGMTDEELKAMMR